MHNFAYLIFNILVFAPVLVLSIVTDVKPFKNWRGLLAAYALVSVPFIIWDIWAAQAGHWGFNSYYILDIRYFRLPFEEILFFFTVPYAMMYVWGVINKHIPAKSFDGIWPNLVLSVIGTTTLLLLVQYWPNGYTRSAMLATILCCAVIALSKMANSLRFWVFQLVLLAVFVATNAILTVLPIITYGDGSIIGTHVATIPIEDFFFNFAFINLFLVVFVTFRRSQTSLTD